MQHRTKSSWFRWPALLCVYSSTSKENSLAIGIQLSWVVLGITAAKRILPGDKTDIPQFHESSNFLQQIMAQVNFLFCIYLLIIDTCRGLVPAFDVNIIQASKTSLKSRTSETFDLTIAICSISFSPCAYHACATPYKIQLVSLRPAKFTPSLHKWDFRLDHCYLLHKSFSMCLSRLCNTL